MLLRHGQQATKQPDGRSLVRGTCVFTGDPHQIIVPTKELECWFCGVLIQDAMPSVSVDDREFLISGVSPKGWKETFKEYDDEINENTNS